MDTGVEGPRVGGKKRAVLPEDITGSLGEMFTKRLGLGGHRTEESETRWESESADPEGSVSSAPDRELSCG